MGHSRTAIGAESDLVVIRLRLARCLACRDHVTAGKCRRETVGHLLRLKTHGLGEPGRVAGIASRVVVGTRRVLMHDLENRQHLLVLHGSRLPMRLRVLPLACVTADVMKTGVLSP